MSTTFSLRPGYDEPRRPLIRSFGSAMLRYRVKMRHTPTRLRTFNQGYPRQNVFDSRSTYNIPWGLFPASVSK